MLELPRMTAGQHNGRVQRLRLCRHVTPPRNHKCIDIIVGYLSLLLSPTVVLRVGVGICRFVSQPTCFRMTDGPLRALGNATSAPRALSSQVDSSAVRNCRGSTSVDGILLTISGLSGSFRHPQLLASNSGCGSGRFSLL